MRRTTLREIDTSDAGSPPGGPEGGGVAVGWRAGGHGVELVDGDFFVAPSGLVVDYDPARAPYDPTAAGGVGPGWITRIAVVDDSDAESQVLYDAALSPETAHFLVDPRSLQPFVTTLYVASFAAQFGIVLRDDAGVPLSSPAAGILRRADGSAVKDHESLATFVRAECEANGGELPARYDAAVPRRMRPAAP